MYRLWYTVLDELFNIEFEVYQMNDKQWYELQTPITKFLSIKDNKSQRTKAFVEYWVEVDATNSNIDISLRRSVSEHFENHNKWSDDILGSFVLTEDGTISDGITHNILHLEEEIHQKLTNFIRVIKMFDMMLSIPETSEIN